jgi:glycosyltransferase involved in cell wall biosynthesis
LLFFGILYFVAVCICYSYFRIYIMNNKEVLYIGGFELPDKNAAAQRVIANGKIFKELGFSVSYLGIDRSQIKNKPAELSKTIFDDFIFYSIKYPSKLSDWLVYLCSIKDVLKIAEGMPFIKYIVAYNYPAIALARLNRWCKAHDIHLIADCTEWYDPEGGFLFKMIKGGDTYLRMKVIHPRLAGIIAISKYLYSFYFEMTNVVQIPPLVDLRSDKWENTCKKDNDELLLVYAGSPGKGSKDRIDTILKALSIIKAVTAIKFSLHIVGLTEQQYVDDFGADRLPGNLEHNVAFKGRLSHKETLNEVKCADYAIFIRDANLVNTAGFPTKFVEALSCGTPVLTNKTSNVSDYLNDGGNGYLLDNSTEEKLVETLGHALSQKQEKINEMKIMIKSTGTFDYRNYIKTTEAFLNVIENTKVNISKH